MVLATAMELFRSKKIKHAVFEYTPFDEFLARNGTDFDTFLPTLFDTLGATKCYALHRRKPNIFEISRSDVALFTETMRKNHMQTDVYCAFVPLKRLAHFASSQPKWTPQTNMADGPVIDEFMHGKRSSQTAHKRAKKDPRFAPHYHSHQANGATTRI